MKKIRKILISVIMIMLISNTQILTKETETTSNYVIASYDYSANIIASLSSNINKIEKSQEIKIALEFNKSTEINTYKAVLEYDENLFEEVSEKDFKTLNSWESLLYNKDTREFISIKKEETKNTEEVIEITLKAKEIINKEQTSISVKNIITSDGENDININSVNITLELVKNNNDIDSENNNDNNDDNNEDNNNNNTDDSEDSNNDNNNSDSDGANNNNGENNTDNTIASGKLPQTGKNNDFIIVTIIILLIIAFISKKRQIKLEKINTKLKKLFMTILVSGIIGSQLVNIIYATNSNSMLKGDLNNDSKINYDDVKILQLHLINMELIANSIVKNADINNSESITITDLSALIKEIQNNYNQEYVLSNIDYTETVDKLDNPERGFYEPYLIKLKPESNTAVDLKYNLVHLRVDIGDFSGKVNGNKDIEFTQDALDFLSTTISNIKKNGGSTIIRFAYDSFNGDSDKEPSLDMILKHIEQLKPVFNENKDAIACVELGFFGPWGEMHSSVICTEENVSKAIDEMLKATPEAMKINVRTPGYYATWAKVDRSKLNENITEKGTNEYRIGIYNDGYLGSDSDLGTFSNRKVEIEWLEEQATHTMYGGEVVANSQTIPINTIEYISEEAFRTHTTYLNNAWNDTVLNSWKNTIYNGENELYKGLTGYCYVENHLGYRFVLRKSEICKNITLDNKLKAKLDIENVGFANLINDKKVTIVLEKDNVKHELNTNIDAKTWNSREISNIDINIDLPENLEIGEWKVYLRISQNGELNTDNNYNCIQFANKDIWNDDIGANYIGTIVKENSEVKKAYSETTSMYSWHQETLVLVKNANSIYTSLKDLNVDTLYQSINSSYMKKEYLEEIIKDYNEQGIVVYRLIGDTSWAYDSTDAKKKIDEIDSYNKSVEEVAKIKGVNLDYEKVADTYSIMNYVKATNISLFLNIKIGQIINL